MLSDLFVFVKSFWRNHRQEIALFVVIVLLSLLSFAIGFITAKLQEQTQESFPIEKPS